MTNKSMVSVPRELLERAARELDWHKTPGAANRASELRALLAAPAEDVRALVDEPVAWTNEITISWFKKPNSGYGQVSARPTEGGETIPLYRHPQRQVVMPERKTYYPGTKDYSAESSGWNACIDEFKRLNP